MVIIFSKLFHVFIMQDKVTGRTGISPTLYKIVEEIEVQVSAVT